jgi:hypothetical protein
MLLKKWMIALSVIAMVATLGLFQGCSENEGPVEPVPNCDIERVISLLATSQISVGDQAYLENLSDSDWELVIQEIEKRDLKFVPKDYVEHEKRGNEQVSALAGCAWNGTTRWNQSLTKARGYKYLGHHAVYFTVDANAACYSKNADWWVYTWTPTHGSVHNWELRLWRDRYWNGGKWVKDVALVVPTTFWSVYYPHWPSSFKAGRFYIRWYHQNNGCCE